MRMRRTNMDNNVYRWEGACCSMWRGSGGIEACRRTGGRRSLAAARIGRRDWPGHHACAPHAACNNRMTGEDPRPARVEYIRSVPNFARCFGDGAYSCRTSGGKVGLISMTDGRQQPNAWTCSHRATGVYEH